MNKSIYVILEIILWKLATRQAHKHGFSFWRERANHACIKFQFGQCNSFKFGFQ